MILGLWGEDMKSIYYYMPPCPRCGSEITGRYIQRPLVKADYMVLESLKNGEIVELRKKVPDKNAFCKSCGFEWREAPRVVWIDEDEKEYERAHRKTEKMMQEYIDAHHIDVYKKPILGGIFSGFTNFF